jgi:hypothetical protein
MPRDVPCLIVAVVEVKSVMVRGLFPLHHSTDCTRWDGSFSNWSGRVTRTKGHDMGHAPGHPAFGKTFINAGDGECGSRMDDDLRNAAAWAVTEGCRPCTCRHHGSELWRLRRAGRADAEP